MIQTIIIKKQLTKSSSKTDSGKREKQFPNPYYKTCCLSTTIKTLQMSLFNPLQSKGHFMLCHHETQIKQAAPCQNSNHRLLWVEFTTSVTDTQNNSTPFQSGRGNDCTDHAHAHTLHMTARDTASGPKLNLEGVNEVSLFQI